MIIRGNYGGILCPSPCDIRGKIIFLRGSFALCPCVFPTLYRSVTLHFTSPVQSRRNRFQDVIKQCRVNTTCLPLWVHAVAFVQLVFYHLVATDFHRWTSDVHPPQGHSGQTGNACQFFKRRKENIRNTLEMIYSEFRVQMSFKRRLKN